MPAREKVSSPALPCSSRLCARRDSRAGGAKVAPWFETRERIYDVQKDDEAYERSLETPCASCLSTPRENLSAAEQGRREAQRQRWVGAPAVQPCASGACAAAAMESIPIATRQKVIAYDRTGALKPAIPTTVELVWREFLKYPESYSCIAV